MPSRGTLTGSRGASSELYEAKHKDKKDTEVLEQVQGPLSGPGQFQAQIQAG